MKIKRQKDSYSTGKTRKFINCSLACILFVLFTGILIVGCKNKWDSEERYSIHTDSIRKNYINIADSISYGVIVRNRDKSDEWQKKWLRTFDRKELVNCIFDAVYSGKLQPYDYFNDEPMSIKQVKEMERKDEFDRSKIGKIQFEERWYFDPDHLKMTKEVYSIMLAYEVYRDNGEFRGYKPSFKVYLNQSITP